MDFRRFAAITAVGALVATGALPAFAQQSAPSGAQSPSAQPSPGQQPSQAQPSQGPQAPSPGQVEIDINALIGSTVRSSDGREVGEVDRLMVDPKQGQITSVIVKRGGTLGMGGEMLSVPWSSVSVGQDQQNVVLTVDQQLLEQAPAASPRTEDQDRQPGTGGQAPPPQQQQRRQQQ